jgi:hypothetical protein
MFFWNTFHFLLKICGTDNDVCAISLQEKRISGVPFHNAMPGRTSGPNAVTGHAVHNIYSHATSGPPFSSNALMRPPYMGSTDVASLSPTEAYRQQHEVTATVCILACLIIASGVYVNMRMRVEMLYS